MAATRKRILVAEPNADFGRLLVTVLREAGHAAEWRLGCENWHQPAPLIQEVAAYAPDLLLLEVHASPETIYGVLDALRADPRTRHTSVLVLTFQPHVAEAAVASFNVSASLAKPFELPQLMAQIEHALRQRRPGRGAAISPADGLAAVAAQLLARHSREALFRWVRRLMARPPWLGRPDARLAEVLDKVPQLVELLVIGLERGGSAEYLRADPTAMAAATEAGKQRRRQGIQIGPLMHEYALLRDELWQVLAEHLPPAVAAPDLLGIVREIDRALDALLERALEAHAGQRRAERERHQAA